MNPQGLLESHPLLVGAMRNGDSENPWAMGAVEAIEALEAVEAMDTVDTVETIESMECVPSATRLSVEDVPLGPAVNWTKRKKV